MDTQLLNDILEIGRYISIGLGLLGVTVEILPIKISPLRWIGNRLNRETNQKIDCIQDQVNRMEYENDMKDLRTVKSRIHNIGRAIKNGENISQESLKSALDDLDVYDYYKERYRYMEINGRQVKINGEVEIDRRLIQNAMLKNNK